jgi:AcrR family transcriptional regulator
MFLLNMFNLKVDNLSSSAQNLNMFNIAASIPTEKGGQTRDTILSCALQLFREKGFEGATMREVALQAGVALGSAYYYFPSKEAIVQTYYDVVQAEHNRRVREALAGHHKMDLKQRLQFAMQSKLDIVQNDRKLLGVVFRYSGEPGHPLSCLGPATAQTRRQSIEVFSRAVGEVRLPRDLQQLLPIALWALQMGILILFLYDDSAHQKRTRNLVDGAIELTVRFVSLAKNPLLRPVRSKVLSLLRETDLLPDFERTPFQAERQPG